MRSVTFSFEEATGEIAKNQAHLLQLLRRDDPVVLPQCELALGEGHDPTPCRDLRRLVQDLRLTPLTDLLPTANEANKRQFRAGRTE